MMTVFQKNRFKQLTNGAVASDQFNANCAEQLAASSTPSLAAPVTHLPTAAFEQTAFSASADDAATTGATVLKSQPRSPHGAPPDPAEPEIDIVINNVVCSFSLGCHLNLRQIALNGHNVEYRRESGMVTMKLRKPLITASVWSSGKITCTGATSEEEARVGARRIARVIQNLGFDAKFRKMRIVNVLGCCSMPFEIKINAFSQRFREADYEPELHPGVTYKLADPKATLKIFSTGSITVTAPSVPNVQLAIEHIYPLVAEFRKELSASAEEMRARKRLLAQQRLEHQHQLHQHYGSQRQPPADFDFRATKRKRLDSNTSRCSSDLDDDVDNNEVESIMSC
ncbi:hypothetical protein V9T40_006664 [Parthenolecanium corni]|uniref:TATA box-binding protein-like 1 n=1 Tax=Parthenolecanium corni TaxID=536013 RepID=A0AAN9Y9R9_9HEMI